MRDAFAKLIARVTSGRGPGKTTAARGRHNNGLGTFYKQRSRWYWNTRLQGTFDIGRNADKRAKRETHGARK